MKDNNGSSIDTAAEGVLTYADLTKLYGEFSDFDMTTVLASPAVRQRSWAWSRCRIWRPLSPAPFSLPFGAQARKCAGMSSEYLIGLDKRFALEMITTDDLSLETDKLIDSQLDVITVSIRVAFRVMLNEAVHVLSL